MEQPKLRFKADDGTKFPDWKENKIGKLGTFTKGAPLSKADISDCGEPLILYGELYTTYNEVAYNIQRRTQSTVDEKYYSHVGDVVIPTSGETAEEISTATCVMAQNVILAGDLNIYRSDIVDGRIMSYILNHQAKWKIAKLAQGKSVVHIQAAQLSGVAVKYPPSTVEQQKIASLFAELDILIQSSEKELEGYRELKQGMLQKMFPKKGEKVPEIRFPEFTGDWEQLKLSEVSDVRDGTHDSPSYQNEGHPFVTSKNVKDGYINYDDIQYISDEDFNNINKRSKVDINDILMGMIGTIGNLALIRTEPDFAIKNVALIKDTKQISYLYLYYYLQSPSTENQLLSGLDGGTQKFISLKKIRELNVSTPSESEQLKIGEYFQNLDSLIASQEQELDGYKELKKGLLQQMFC